jgi:tRNA A37 threonylcarbamoyltransferase TsaD
MTPTPSLSLLTTTVVGLITDNNKTAYREEVRDLAVWCQDNIISLYVSKAKEMIVDYRKRRAEHARPHSHQRG